MEKIANLPLGLPGPKLNAMQKAIAFGNKIKPRAIEAGATAIPGAAIGGLTGVKEDKEGKKHIGRNALIGGVLGASVGPGLNTLSKSKRTINMNNNNGKADAVHKGFKKFYDETVNGDVQSVARKRTEEKHYGQVHDITKEKRESIIKHRDSFIKQNEEKKQNIDNFRKKRQDERLKEKIDNDLRYSTSADYLGHQKDTKKLVDKYFSRVFARNNGNFSEALEKSKNFEQKLSVKYNKEINTAVNTGVIPKSGRMKKKIDGYKSIANYRAEQDVVREKKFNDKMKVDESLKALKKHIKSGRNKDSLRDPINLNDIFNGKFKHRTINKAREYNIKGLAEVEANKQSASKYYNKFIKPGANHIDISGDNNKAFGHLKKVLRGDLANKNISDKTKKLRSLLHDHEHNANLDNIFGSFLGRPSDGPKIRDLKGVETKVNDVLKDHKFNQHVSDIEHGAIKDAKKGKKFDYFNKADEEARAKIKMHVTDDEMSGYDKLFGANLKNMKTKNEFNSAYKKIALKNHPDRNTSEEAKKIMLDANAARDKIRNSEFYEKLACASNEVEELYKIATYFN